MSLLRLGGQNSVCILQENFEWTRTILCKYLLLNHSLNYFMWRLLLHWTFEIYKNGKCYKRRVVTINEGKLEKKCGTKIKNKTDWLEILVPSLNWLCIFKRRELNATQVSKLEIILIKLISGPI